MIKRKLWEKLQKNLNDKQALVITGPRRVGKTTTLRWLLEQTKSKNQIFFDIENLGDRKIFEVTDYNDVIESLKVRGLDTSSKMYIAIDEIQFLPNITSVVKYLYDHYDIKFYLSGSSSYYLKNHFTESMAGRKFLFELLPLSFQEFLDFREAKYALPEIDLASQPAKFPDLTYTDLSNYYDEYIQYGGFPSVVLEPQPEKKLQLLDEFFSTYINQDVTTWMDFSSTGDLRRLVSLLAARVGNRLNVMELSEVSGIPRSKISAWIEFLEQTYLIKTLPVESTSEDVRVRNLKKLYFVDTGIASVNADLSSGQKFENALAGQLSNYGKLSYYDNGRQEVDFILEQNGQKIALEAKETPTGTDLNTLRFVANEKLNIKDFALIGKQKSQKFSEYIWGGEIS